MEKNPNYYLWGEFKLLFALILNTCLSLYMLHPILAIINGDGYEQFSLEDASNLIPYIYDFMYIFSKALVVNNSFDQFAHTIWHTHRTKKMLRLSFEGKYTIYFIL